MTRSKAPVLRNKGVLLPGGPAEKIIKGVASLAQSRGATSHPQKTSSSSSRKKKSRRPTHENQSGSSFPMARAVGFSNSSGSRISSTGPCREFVADLGSPSSGPTFSNLLTLPLNPGNSRLFKRLVAEADLYEQWRFKYMRFVYEPSTAVVNSGVVGMYVDHDPSDTAASNMAAVMAHGSATMGPIYRDLSLSVSTVGITTWYFCNQGYTDTNDAAARQNSPGDFRFFCDKVAPSLSLGYLYVEYDIEFRFPKDPASLILGYQVGDFAPTVLGSLANLSLPHDFDAAVRRVNRGFTWEDEAARSDDIPSSFSTGQPVYWPCTAQSGNYSLSPQGSIVFAPTVVGTTVQLQLGYVAPGSNTYVFTWNSPTYTVIAGGSVTWNLSVTPLVATTGTIPGGSRLYFRLINLSSNPVTVNPLSLRFTLASISEYNVSSSRKFDEIKTQDSPARTFVIPEQIEELQIYLEGSGPSIVTVQTVNRALESSVLCDIEMLEQRLRDMRFALSSSIPPSSSQQAIEHSVVGGPRYSSRDEAVSSRPPSAFSVISRR